MKTFFKACILLLSTQFVMAQDIKVGVKGTFNLSSISKPDIVGTVLDFNSFPTGGGSVFVEIPIDNEISFRPEVAYSRKGSQMKNIKVGDLVGGGGSWWGSILNNGIQPKVYLDYLDVPLLFKYKFGNNGASHGYILAGPAVSFLLDQGVRANIFGMGHINLPVKGNINLPVNMNLNKVDIAGQIGAGYEFPFRNRMNAFVEAKYEHGFTNVIKDLYVFDIRSKNRNFAISAGFTLPLGK